MNNKSMTLILFVLILLIGIATIAAVTQRTKANAPPVSPQPNSLDATLVPLHKDPDIQEALKHAPKLKIYPPNHPEGIEP